MGWDNLNNKIRILNKWNHAALTVGGSFDGLILDEDAAIFM